MPDLRFEGECPAGALVAGVDEAGRGPWAGPVVAAAVIIDVARIPDAVLAEIDDSKVLAADRRERIFDQLTACATIAVGQADVLEIDVFNIRQATLLAMRRAVEALETPPTVALVDGRDLPALGCEARALVGGDGASLSIAAASIVAKVTRDRIMQSLDRVHPGYGWSTNMGYGTKQHWDALQRFGPCPLHRRSFRPVSEAMTRNLCPDAHDLLDLESGRDPLSS
jgi:ribonuclease HII